MKGKIERRCSIEKEPRTLSFHQLQYAREAALYVLNTNSIEYAIHIFTQGLEPVMDVKNGSKLEMDNTTMMMDSDDEIAVDHVLAIAQLRETLTAPF